VVHDLGLDWGPDIIKDTKRIWQLSGLNLATARDGEGVSNFPEVGELCKYISPSTNSVWKLALERMLNGVDMLMNLGIHRLFDLEKAYVGNQSSTTGLHCDVSDAINIAVWGSEDRVAEWSFIQNDSDGHALGPGYIDPETLIDMGLDVLSIYQHVGQAIIIPVGMPHQVKNLCKVTKFARDFISKERFAMTNQLYELIRENNFKNVDNSYELSSPISIPSVFFNMGNQLM
jgi:hypothetical protein